MTTYKQRQSSSGLLKSEEGFALATVIVLTFFLFALVASYFGLIVIERSAVFSTENDLKAEVIAEAGIEEALWEYNFGGNDFSGWSGGGSDRSKTANMTDGGGNVIGSYTVTIDDYLLGAIAPYPFATSVGTFNVPGGATKQVTLKAQLGPRARFSGAITAKEIVRFTGNGFTNSYNSVLGPYGGANIFLNGDVRTNLKNTASAILVSANGNPVIGGDASTGTGSTVSDPSKVSGTVQESPQHYISDVSVPAAILGLGSSGSLTSTPVGIPLAPGNYKYDEIDVGGNNIVVTGIDDPLGTVSNNVVTIYVTGDTQVGGSGQLRVNPGSTLIIYAGGDDMDIGGNGIANLSGTQYPYRLQVYGTPNLDNIDVHGGPDFIAAIKAPQASVSITGSPAFYGAFVANDVTASGGGGVHFDEQLLNTFFSPNDGVEVDWIRRI